MNYSYLHQYGWVSRHNVKQKKLGIEYIQYDFLYIMTKNGKCNTLFKNTLYRKTIKKKEWWIHGDNDDGYHQITCSVWGLGLSSLFNAAAKHSPGTRKCSRNVSEWWTLLYCSVYTGKYGKGTEELQRSLRPYHPERARTCLISKLSRVGPGYYLDGRTTKKALK